MWKDPVARPENGHCDPRDRDVLRRDGGGARHRGGRDPFQRRLVPGGAARPLRRRRAGGGVAAASRARDPGDSRGAGRGGRDARGRRPRRGDAGPGADRRAPRRPRRGEGGRVVAAAAARRRSTTSTATSPRSTSSPTRSSRRSSVCSPAAATRCCSTSARTPSGSCSARRSTTRRARRSTRAPACSGSATRAAARSTGSHATETRSAYDFPVARVPGLDFSFSGLKTALLYAVRDLAEDELEARRADLAASYQHAIVRALVERVTRGRRADRAAADRDRRRSRGELGAPRRAPGRDRCAARPLHRQRGDDRLGGPLDRAHAVPSVPRA